METNDTTSIMSTLPQQRVVSGLGDPEFSDAQLHATASSLLREKLGASVLPTQAALPYGALLAKAGAQGNISAGGTALTQAAGKTQGQGKGTAGGASQTAVGASSGAVAGAAGKLLPAQAHMSYPQHNPEAQNATGSDLYQSKGALATGKEAAANDTRLVWHSTAGTLWSALMLVLLKERPRSLPAQHHCCPVVPSFCILVHTHVTCPLPRAPVSRDSSAWQVPQRQVALPDMQACAQQASCSPSAKAGSQVSARISASAWTGTQRSRAHSEEGHQSAQPHRGGPRRLQEEPERPLQILCPGAPLKLPLCTGL